MKPTVLALGAALVAMLAPTAAAELVWSDGANAGADLGWAAASVGVRGIDYALRPDAQGPPPPPPPIGGASGHEPDPAPEAHEASEPHHAHAPPSEPEPAPPAEERAPPAPVTSLVPLPIVGAGPVPRLDVSALTSQVTTLVPRLPDVAPAYGPQPARPAPVAPMGETIEPAGVVAPSTPAFVVGVAAAAAAASATPVASPLLGRLRRLGLLAVLYSRIAKERLLDHGSRERLLQAVSSEAGASIADLAERTGLPRNTVTYHMRVLERERLVSSTRQGRHRLYFAPGSLERREHADLMVALRHDTTRAVAEEIARTPGVDQKALCERTGISPSLAHWHTRRLVEAGAVDSRRDGRNVRYYPAGAPQA